MSRKVKGASIISLVATLGVVLLGTDGSSAMAETNVALPEQLAAAANRVPIDSVAIADSESARGNQAVEPASATQFISTPIVQSLPAQTNEGLAGLPRNAASLAELVAEEPVPGKLDEQMRCLAGAIYFESKGEPLAGQLAVGRVVVARARSGRFPSSYCGVVYQRSQFSFVRRGTMPTINTSSNAWKKAKQIALIAHDGAWKNPAEGALFFHARYVSPSWKKNKKRLAQIDNHIFYR